MTTSITSQSDATYGADPARPLARGTKSTETKSAFKTTELIVYVASVVGVLIAALVTDPADDGQDFGARTAWLYITLLSIGYMISRGLAKSGSRRRSDA